MSPLCCLLREGSGRTARLWPFLVQHCLPRVPPPRWVPTQQEWGRGAVAQGGGRGDSGTSITGGLLTSCAESHCDGRNSLCIHCRPCFDTQGAFPPPGVLSLCIKHRQRADPGNPTPPWPVWAAHHGCLPSSLFSPCLEAGEARLGLEAAE